MPVANTLAIHVLGLVEAPDLAARLSVAVSPDTFVRSQVIATAAGVYSAAYYLGDTHNGDDFTRITEIFYDEDHCGLDKVGSDVPLSDHLNEVRGAWLRDGEQLVFLCGQFVNDFLKRAGIEGTSANTLELAVGCWLLWGLVGKSSPQEDVRFGHMLGRLVMSEFVGWSAPKTA